MIILYTATTALRQLNEYETFIQNKTLNYQFEEVNNKTFNTLCKILINFAVHGKTTLNDFLVKYFKLLLEIPGVYLSENDVDLLNSDEKEITDLV